MSFRVFASGVLGGKPFHYAKDNNLDGSEFETMRVLAILNSLKPTSTKVEIGTAAMEYVHNPTGILDIVDKMATMEFLHTLSNAVSVLALNPNTSDGWISVSSRRSNLLLPNSICPETVAFAKYKFLPGNNPGAEFIKMISPGLVETGLNHWGVLRILALVLGKYANQLDDSMNPIINIQLFK